MLQGLSPNLNIIMKAIEKASKILVRDFGEIQQLQNSLKGIDKFILASRKKAEEILIEELLASRNKSGYISYGVKKIGINKNEFFIINPIDGIENYRKGIPYFSISVGLQDGDSLIAGVVYNPVLDSLYYAEKGGGAFLSESRTSRRMRCGNKLDLSESIVLVSSTFEKSENKIKSEQIRKLCDNISISTRIMGATSLDLCYLADNKVDAFLGHNENILSASAGMLIAKESGAFMSSYTLDGKENKSLFQTDYFIASNTKLKNALAEFIKPEIK
jgi:myo-inositol-1(or 4)-monophosphatase